MSLYFDKIRRPIGVYKSNSCLYQLVDQELYLVEFFMKIKGIYLEMPRPVLF